MVFQKKIFKREVKPYGGKLAPEYVYTCLFCGGRVNYIKN